MWKFAMIEAGALFLYFIATLFGSAKSAFYTQLSLTSILPYETAKIIVLFGVQFALTAYVFILWYHEEYKIRKDSVLHVGGIFQTTKKSIPLSAAGTVTVRSGLIGRIFHYGNVEVRSGDSFLRLKTVSRPEYIVKAIYEGPMAASFADGHDIHKLLASEENDRLEFKSSLRYDYKAGNVNRELEKAALKTVAAFLNSKGGYLVVGVDDARVSLGLERDFESLQRKDKDGFENHFTQAFNAAIGPEFRDLVKLKFAEMGEHDLCLVEVLPSYRPVYFRSNNSENFYIRTGNITSTLTLSEMESYIRSRWPKFL